MGLPTFQSVRMAVPANNWLFFFRIGQGFPHLLPLCLNFNGLREV
jgi:hypothetical protein